MSVWSTKYRRKILPTQTTQQPSRDPIRRAGSAGLPRLFTPSIPSSRLPPFRPQKPGGIPPIPPGFPLPKRASGTPSWENGLLLIKRALSPSALHRIPGFARVRCARIGQDKTGSLLWSRRHILLSRFHSLWKKKLSLQEKLQTSKSG